MGFSELLSLIVTITAVVGGLVGLAAYVISLRTERRAARAETQSNQSRQGALVERAYRRHAEEIAGVNDIHQDVRPVLVRVRTAMTELVDGMPAGEHPNLEGGCSPNTGWFASNSKRPCST